MTTLGENQRFVLLPKRELFKHYDMLTVSEMTKACYTPTAAKAILEAFCSEQPAWPADAARSAKIRKDDLQRGKALGKNAGPAPKTEAEWAQSACMAENLRVSPEDGSVEFRGAIVKQKFDWGASGKTLLGKKFDISQLNPLLLDSCRNKPERMQKDLEPAYWSQLPHLLSDVYDTRSTRYRKIENGSPVSLIVNRVYLSEKLDRIFPAPINGQEIAIVLSVLDGSESGGRDTLVAYEQKLDPMTRLPLGDLLAYTTDNYRGQPIRVTLTVFELDSLKMDSVRPLFTQAASLAKNALPVAPGLLGAAESLGKFLLSNRSDDIAMRFTFQLYPWSLDGSVGANMGEPKIAEATYMVINTIKEKKTLIDDTRKIQIGWNLLPYWVKSVREADLPSLKGGLCESRSYRPNYLPACAYDDELRADPKFPNQALAPPQIPFRTAATSRQQVREFSYAMLTVTKTAMISGKSIIDRADQLLRRVAGMDGQSTLDTINGIADAKQLLEGLTDSVALLQGQQELLRGLGGDDPKRALTDFADRTKTVIKELKERNLDPGSNSDIGKAISLIRKTSPDLGCPKDAKGKTQSKMTPDECLLEALSKPGWSNDFTYDPISRKYFDRK
ncbi:MAG: hypothetical protein V4709_07935 [Pseudomonadota bacterium]